MWVKRWLRLLSLARKFSRYNGIPAESPRWTEEDAGALRKFFQSRSGQKLRIELVTLTNRQASRAIETESGLEYRAGWAAGFKGCLACIDQYMAQAEEPEGEIEKGVPTDDLEWMR